MELFRAGDFCFFTEIAGCVTYILMCAWNRWKMGNFCLRNFFVG